MKRFLFFALFTLGCSNITNAQDLRSEDLKTRLNMYRTLCIKLTEHIDSIQKCYGNLPEKIQKNAKVAGLVKRINADINRIYPLSNTLDEQIATLIDSLKTGKNTNENPVETRKELAPPSEKTSYQITREPLPKYVPQPIKENKDDLIKYLQSFYSLKDLYADKDNVRNMLEKHRDSPQYATYDIILRLISIPDAIYNRIEFRDILQKTYAIREDQLVRKEHYETLQSEFEYIKGYRYATTELQRLIKLVSNPTDDIKKNLSGGASPAEDNLNKGEDKLEKGKDKFDDDSDLKAFSSKDIANYLIKNDKGIEYIKNYKYTWETFNKYVEEPGERNNIETQLDDALKLK